MISLQQGGIRERVGRAALTTLAILQTVMLAALYAGVPPHPPNAIPLFGIAPFLGVSLSAVAAAAILGGTQTQAGRLFCGLAALLALGSFGPQKYLDGQFAQIWPAVVSGQLAAGVLLLLVFRGSAKSQVEEWGA